MRTVVLVLAALATLGSTAVSAQTVTAFKTGERTTGMTKLELTRFGGHLISTEKGVYHGENETSVRAGVSASANRAGALGTYA